MQKLMPLLRKDLKVTFGKHSFQIHIHDMYQARLADLTNKPDRRQDSDGTYYTPTVLVLDCGEEKINIYVEDVARVIPQINGLLLDMYNWSVQFSWS